MKIAIIGAGFTGLTAAHELSKKGFQITVFEKSRLPGGLARGFGEKKWQWSLEEYYHHLFVSDKAILKLAKELNIPIIFKRPKTSVFIDKKIFPLDSPLSLLEFPELSFLSRLRMGVVLFCLRVNPFWKPLEKIPAAKWLSLLMGKKAYGMIWEPLLISKFGEYSKNVPLSWFWARIKKRSARLGYPEGGFQTLIEKVVSKIKENGGKFYFDKEIASLSDLNHFKKFDRIILTTPTSLPMLGALTLILVLKEKFLTDNTYWLNICNKNYPFLSVVEHTNFIDKKYYNNEHLVYVGGYYPQNHRYFKMKKEEILKEFLPYLQKINPRFNFQLNAIRFTLYANLYAQPVIPLNYSKIIPPLKTPLKNVYLANMQQVYPWDRGTNYAVELGGKVAELVAD